MNMGVTNGKKPSLTKSVHVQAQQLLARPHTLPTLISALLFCLLVTVMLYSAQSLLYYTAYLVVKSEVCFALIEGLLLVLLGLAFWLICMPLWLAKLRMAGLLWYDRVPAAREILYGFSTRSRYFRALRVGALQMLLYLLPMMAVGGLFAGAYNVFKILYASVNVWIAFLALPPLFLVAVALSAFVLFLSGFTVLFGAVAVGNETLSVRGAFVIAVRVGRKNLKTLFVFALKNLLWLLLSLATVGILYALWFSHRYTLSYLRLSIILTSKENEI